MIDRSYRLGVVDAHAAIAEGRLAVDDYLESCIARTLAVEPSVHAFAHFDPHAVRAAAASASPDGRLYRIPVGIKDVIATKGMPTEMGSAAFRGHVPDRSASVIDALIEASAIVYGKTVTTEFAWRQPGATRNPWNLDHTPGGSSSGSAAAVACGAVPAALGTQTLGSVLRPAAFCGVVGYKPSFGAIPRTGVYPVSASLDHVGVFARSVGDAALVASVLAASDGIDFAGRVRPADAWPLRHRDTAPRIALLRTTRWDRASIEQQALIDSVARRLEAAGATITELTLPPLFDALWTTAATLADVEGAAVNAELAAESPPRIASPTLDLVARGSATPVLDYVHARGVQRSMIQAFAPIVAPFDAVLMAPATGEAPRGLDDTGDAVFCTPGSLLGAPAISMPAGVAPSGLPMGVQLLGAWSDDRRLLETAAWVEAVIAWSPGLPMDDAA